MTRITACLPESLIRLMDVRGNERHQVFDEGPLFRVEFSAQGRSQMRPVDELAMNVDLALLIGGIANAYGPAAATTLEVLQGLLVEPHFRADAVHNLDLAGPLATHQLEKSAEALRFAAVAEDGQRVEREARIAQPAIAVIPVPLAADPFRQRGGRRRHDRAGRRIGQQLQRQRAAPDHVPVRSIVAAIGDPLAPERMGDLETDTAM